MGLQGLMARGCLPIWDEISPSDGYVPLGSWPAAGYEIAGVHSHRLVTPKGVDNHWMVIGGAWRRHLIAILPWTYRHRMATKVIIASVWLYN